MQSINPMQFNQMVINELEDAFGSIGTKERRDGKEQKYYHRFCKYDPRALKATVTEIIDERQKNGFPLIAEFREVADKHQRRFKPTSSGDEKKKKEDAEWKDRADYKMTQPIGQTAMREGWGYMLWCEVFYQHNTQFTNEDVAEFRAINQRDFDMINKVALSLDEFKGMVLSERKKNVKLLQTPYEENIKLAKKFLKEGSPCTVPMPCFDEVEQAA